MRCSAFTCVVLQHRNETTSKAEARKAFRENRHADPGDIEAKVCVSTIIAAPTAAALCLSPFVDAALTVQIADGENRLQIALHYHIPYPRLHHAGLLKVRDKPELGTADVPHTRYEWQSRLGLFMPILHHGSVF